jgi:Transglycosylase-like domain
MPKRRKSRLSLTFTASLVFIMIPALAATQPWARRPQAGTASVRLSVRLLDSMLSASAHTPQPQPEPSVRALWVRQHLRWQSYLDLKGAARARARRELADARAAALVGFGTLWPDWPAIADCESDGRWDTNSSNGFWGGLQFFPHTWFAFGGGAFDGVGPFPYSKLEQIIVAWRVLGAQGPSAWPSCFRWK